LLNFEGSNQGKNLLCQLRGGTSAHNGKIENDDRGPSLRRLIVREVRDDLTRLHYAETVLRTLLTEIVSAVGSLGERKGEVTARRTDKNRKV